MERPWLNPTGGMIRGLDVHGEGTFGASRDGGKRRHMGVDYVALPGQNVVCPCTSKVVKLGYCYQDDLSYRYVALRLMGNVTVRLLYVLPQPSLLPNDDVTAGDILGTAQSLEGRYPRITPHVHLDIRRDGEWLDPNEWI